MGRKPIKDAAETKSGRAVLLALGRYHYLTIAQLTRYLGYSVNSRKYIEEAVRFLASQHYVYNENTLPSEHGGHYGSVGAQSVVSLKEKGDATLTHWGFNPGVKIRHEYKRRMDFLGHTYDLNQTLIALEHFALTMPGVELEEFMHEQQLSKKAVRVEVSDGTTLVANDAYVAYRMANNDVHAFPIEQDRGTERKNDKHQGGNWFDKLAKLIAFASGPYREVYPFESLTYIIPINSIVKPNQRRLEDVLAWTEEYLRLTNQEDWADAFRFTIADPVAIAPADFVIGAHWFTPFRSHASSLVDPSYFQMS